MSLRLLRPLALASLLAGLVALPALAGGKAQVVKVEDLDMSAGKMAMKLSTDKVAAGKVTFVSSNPAKQTRDHEVLLIKTDLEPGQLPMGLDGMTIDESKLTGIVELGDLKPGETSKATVDLAPGRYLLFCNMPGHTQAGMFAKLEVSGTAADAATGASAAQTASTDGDGDEVNGTETD